MTPGDPNAYLVHRSVQPVTQADELLRELVLDIIWEGDPGGTGWHYAGSVTDGERWKLHGFKAAMKTGGATLTTDKFRAFPSATQNIQLDAYTATAEHSHLFAEPVPLDSGWDLQINVSAYTAGDIVILTGLYIKEKVF